MLQFGGRFFDDQGKVVIDSPQNLKALTMMVDMIRKDGIAAPAPGGDRYNPSYWAAYGKGDFAAQYGADWMAAVMRSSVPDLQHRRIHSVVRPAGAAEARAFEGR